jgi:hypothetical protein
MFVSQQARQDGSNLRRFLDARLPGRSAITSEWRSKLDDAPSREVAIEADRSHLGRAFEVRVGLDLADRPAHMNLLSYLPPAECQDLLLAAGFSVNVNPYIPDTGTVDPLLRDWQRTSNPAVAVGDPAQLAALAACSNAVSMDNLDHKAGRDFSVELRRGFYTNLEEAGPNETDDPTLRAMSLLWASYIEWGRSQLASLGERVLIAPELAPGFAVADLVIVRTLVELKTSSYAARDMDVWLNQLLAYLLLDRWNVLYIDRLALYVGWEALVLQAPVARLLAAATPGRSPDLSALRTEFYETLQEDIDHGACWRLRQMYPMPVEAIGVPPESVR